MVSHWFATEGLNTSEEVTFPSTLSPTAKPTWTRKSARTRPFVRKNATDNSYTAQKRLPFKQFQVLLTPSSGSFSSFPHGTCSLSVSRPYLAWDGTYHPLRAAIPNNSTLWYSSVRSWHEKETRLSLSMAAYSNDTCLPFRICYPHHQTTILLVKGRF